MRTVIFFRAEKKFKPPTQKHFDFPVSIHLIDVGDILEEIEENISKIYRAILSIDAIEIFICAATPLAFIWILCTEVLPKFPGKTFHFLQMERGTKKKYQLWR